MSRKGQFFFLPWELTTNVLVLVVKFILSVALHSLTRGSANENMQAFTTLPQEDLPNEINTELCPNQKSRREPQVWHFKKQFTELLMSAL